MVDGNHIPEGAPPDVLLLEVRRALDGKILIRSPGLSLDGIERELLGALTIVRRQLDAKAVLVALGQSASRIVTARGVPPAGLIGP